MYIAKVKTAVYFNGERHEVGKEVEIEETDLDERLFEVIEEIKETKELKYMNVSELKEIAKDYGIEGYSNMKKEELIQAIEGE